MGFQRECQVIHVSVSKEATVAMENLPRRSGRAGNNSGIRHEHLDGYRRTRFLPPGRYYDNARCSCRLNQLCPSQKTAELNPRCYPALACKPLKCGALRPLTEDLQYQGIRGPPHLFFGGDVGKCVDEVVNALLKYQPTEKAHWTITIRCISLIKRRRLSIQRVDHLRVAWLIHHDGVGQAETSADVAAGDDVQHPSPCATYELVESSGGKGLERYTRALMPCKREVFAKCEVMELSPAKPQSVTRDQLIALVENGDGLPHQLSSNDSGS
jgi:hypothetical protein